MLFMLLNVLPHFLLQNFFSYFPPLTLGASYGLKNTVPAWSLSDHLTPLCLSFTIHKWPLLLELLQ